MTKMQKAPSRRYLFFSSIIFELNNGAMMKKILILAIFGFMPCIGMNHQQYNLPLILVSKALSGNEKLPENHNANSFDSRTSQASLFMAFPHFVQKYIISEPIICPRAHCNETFSDNMSLRSHMESAHSKKCYTCSHCPADNPQIYASPRALDEHIMAKHLNKKINCSQCPSQFTTKIALTRHERTSHKKTLYNCGYCNKPYRYVSGVKRHIKKKHPSESLGNYKILRAQPNTSEYIPQPATIDTSVAVNLNAPTLLCHESLLDFTDDTINTNTDAFVDESSTEWDRNNSYNFQLTDQEAEDLFDEYYSGSMQVDKPHLHTAENTESTTNTPIVISGVLCSLCNKKYNTNGALRAHIAAGHEQKRFFCQLCPPDKRRPYVGRSPLLAHIETIHQNKRYNCPKCNKLLAKGSMPGHVKRCMIVSHE